MSSDGTWSLVVLFFFFILENTLHVECFQVSLGCGHRRLHLELDLDFVVVESTFFWL